MEPRVERALRELTEALAGSRAVARVRQAREVVESREAARVMLRDLEGLQGQILERARRGESVPEELASRYQQVAQLASYNPYVRELLESQAELVRVLDEIQQAVLKAAGLTPPESPADPDDRSSEPPKQAGEAAPGRISRAPGSDARSRLWVPGRGTP